MKDWAEVAVLEETTPHDQYDDPREWCPLCQQEISEYHITKTITMDLDPGDCEVGPQPDIQECKAHNHCARYPEQARRVAKFLETLDREVI